MVLLKTVRRHFSSSRWSRKFASSSGEGRFEDYLSFRRSQAEKSLLVQVNAKAGGPEVRDYLSKFGHVAAVYHYSVPLKGKWGGGGSGAASIPPSSGEFHWLLAEFEEKEDFLRVMDSCGYPEGTVPFTSAMTLFRGGRTSSSKKSGKESQNSIETDIPSERLGIIKPPPPKFGKGKTLDQQLAILEESVKLTDLGVRVRFFVASLLETAFRGMFPQGCVLPFGSTVSGIGRQSGDLDLVLLPDKKEIFTSSRNKSAIDKNSQLLFQSKMTTSGNSSNARFQVQRVMETMADVIQLFVPGCTHVQRILQARVPILRFWSDYTELQCDLSMTNSSGVHMSELIYLMTKLDPRFSTLLFAIRSWASARKITNPVPGRQPTNFMFVLLLIYFMQSKKILPTLDVLFNNPEKKDYRTTADGIDCSFLRDHNLILKRFSPQSKTESAAELLFEFFEFYSEFDFNAKGVSLLTGSAWGKPDAGPLYIQNPLERHLNVARNVSREEVSRFKSECCSALWKFETTTHSPEHNASIQDLLLTSQYESNKNGDHRIKVKELFSE